MKWVRTSLKLMSLREIHTTKVSFADIFEDEGFLTKDHVQQIDQTKSCNYKVLRKARPMFDMVCMGLSRDFPGA